MPRLSEHEQRTRVAEKFKEFLDEELLELRGAVGLSQSQDPAHDAILTAKLRGKIALVGRMLDEFWFTDHTDDKADG